MRDDFYLHCKYLQREWSLGPFAFSKMIEWLIIVTRSGVGSNLYLKGPIFRHEATEKKFWVVPPLYTIPHKSLYAEVDHLQVLHNITNVSEKETACYIVGNTKTYAKVMPPVPTPVVTRKYLSDVLCI